MPLRGRARSLEDRHHKVQGHRRGNNHERLHSALPGDRPPASALGSEFDCGHGPPSLDFVSADSAFRVPMTTTT